MEASIAIETSERPGSIALGLAGGVLGRILADGRAHARDLLPELAELYLRAGCTPSVKPAMTEVFVGLGPGSYTGLRVGVATALGLARGSGAAVRGVPSFQILCFGALRPGEVATVVRNARANRFYHGCYERTEKDVVCLEEERALRAEELRARLAEFRGTVFTDATTPSEAELEPHPAARWVMDARPRAEDLVALGRHRIRTLGPHGLDELDPLYLRAFGE